MRFVLANIHTHEFKNPNLISEEECMKQKSEKGFSYSFD